MRQRILARPWRGLALLVLLGGLSASILAASLASLVQAAPLVQGNGTLAVGSGAWVTGTGGAGVNVHSAPLVSTTIVGTLLDGTPVQVLEGPITGSGLTWYRVSAAGLAGSGWTDGAYLVAAPPAPPVLPVGSTARVGSTQGSGLDVRSAPLLASAVTGGLGPGTLVQVLEGPVAGDNLSWYRVTAPDLTSPGWVDGQYLAAVPVAAPAPIAAGPPAAALPPPADPGAGAPSDVLPAPPPPPASTPVQLPTPGPSPTPTPSGPPPLSPGSAAVIVNSGSLGLRVHANPGLSAPQVGTIYDGTRVEILAGPANVDGRLWYQVSANTPAVQGWVIMTVLSPTP